jgi:fructose-1,6-bisphosphatase II / sedoheptulose-1,7-bisphosphatase
MVKASHVLDRVLVLEMVRVTEAAAVAASKLIGRGDEKAADRRRGRGDARGAEHARDRRHRGDRRGRARRGADALYRREGRRRAGRRPAIDIALDPLEGTTITAKAGANAMAVLAIAEHGCLLNAPDVYMEKLAVGPGYPDGIIDLEERHREYPRRRRRQGGGAVEIITCVLDRPRHER